MSQHLTLTSGVDFTGAIVIARYGAIFRGLKVILQKSLSTSGQIFAHARSVLQIKGAQELGAVGCLIYSDPRDDGSVTVENGYAE